MLQTSDTTWQAYNGWGGRNGEVGQNLYDPKSAYAVSYSRLLIGALLGHKAFISVGHVEYWSGDQRANVTAARDADVNLLFWSGNEVYWKTRWETSIVDGVAYRTIATEGRGSSGKTSPGTDLDSLIRL